MTPTAASNKGPISVQLLSYGKIFPVVLYTVLFILGKSACAQLHRLHLVCVYPREKCSLASARNPAFLSESGNKEEIIGYHRHEPTVPIRQGPKWGSKQWRWERRGFKMGDYPGTSASICGRPVQTFPYDLFPRNYPVLVFAAQRPSHRLKQTSAQRLLLMTYLLCLNVGPLPGTSMTVCK